MLVMLVVALLMCILLSGELLGHSWSSDIIDVMEKLLRFVTVLLTKGSVSYR